MASCKKTPQCTTGSMPPASWKEFPRPMRSSSRKLLFLDRDDDVLLGTEYVFAPAPKTKSNFRDVMTMFPIERPDVIFVVTNGPFRIGRVVETADAFRMHVVEERWVVARRDSLRGLRVPEEVSDHGASARFQDPRDLAEIILDPVGEQMGEDR